MDNLILVCLVAIITIVAYMAGRLVGEASEYKLWVGPYPKKKGVWTIIGLVRQYQLASDMYMPKNRKARLLKNIRKESRRLFGEYVEEE